MAGGALSAAVGIAPLRRPRVPDAPSRPRPLRGSHGPEGVYPDRVNALRQKTVDNGQWTMDKYALALAAKKIVLRGDFFLLLLLLWRWLDISIFRYLDISGLRRPHKKIAPKDDFFVAKAKANANAPKKKRPKPLFI